MHQRTLITILLLAAAPLAGRAAVLITPQEAQLPSAQAAADAGAGGFQGDRGTPTRPPDVLVQSPKGIVASPFPLRITFTPHNGARIDPNSVTVTLLTKPEVDLTNRVQQYISPHGVDFAQAEAPPGRYRIRIDLTDDAGHIGTATVDLQVQHP
jgi:hypothetical protein